MKKPLEMRLLPQGASEIRAETNDGVTRLSGYGAVIGQVSEDLGGFREIIAPGAFDGVLDRGDQVVEFNHSDLALLGRKSSGTARFKVDERGLHYEVDLPDTGAGRDVGELVRRGDVVGSSFRFIVDTDKWEMKDGEELRTIVKVAEVFEAGPVVSPAYPDTTVAERGLEEFRSANPAPSEGAEGDETARSARVAGMRRRVELAELEA